MLKDEGKKKHSFRGTKKVSSTKSHAVLSNARITTGESTSNDGDDLRLESN